MVYARVFDIYRPVCLFAVYVVTRYAEFLRERNEMAHRDWLSMRDQVGQE
jgi:hypothetical protein